MPERSDRDDDRPTTRRAWMLGGVAVLLTSAAAATWWYAARRPGSMILAMAPTAGADAMRQRANDLAAYLSRRAQLEITGDVASDYEALTEGLADNRIHLAWLPPLAYRRAADHGAIGLVTALRDGRASYHAALIVRSGSEITRLEHLIDKRVGWVDPLSAAGYLFPRKLLADHGLDPDGLFAEERFLGGHGEVCEAVANGSVDVGATFLPACAKFLPDAERRVIVLAKTEPIPGDTLAAAASVAPEIRAKLVAILLAMADDPEGRPLLDRVFGAERFVRAETAAYQF